MGGYGYLRVSGKGQIDKDGFKRQREIISKFATESSIDIPRYYKEKGISGTKGEGDCLAFQKILVMIQNCYILWWSPRVVLRSAGKIKIDCGREHFKVLGSDVEFTVLIHLKPLGISVRKCTNENVPLAGTYLLYKKREHAYTINENNCQANT